jgi:hypothetical protein
VYVLAYLHVAFLICKTKSISVSIGEISLIIKYSERCRKRRNSKWCLSWNVIHDHDKRITHTETHTLLKEREREKERRKDRDSKDYLM